MNLKELVEKVITEDIDILKTPLYVAKSYYNGETGLFENQRPIKVWLSVKEGKEEFVKEFFKDTEKLESFMNKGRQYNLDFKKYINEFQESVSFKVEKEGKLLDNYADLKLLTITPVSSFWEKIHSSLNFFLDEDKCLTFYEIKLNSNINRHKKHIEEFNNFMEGRILYLQNEIKMTENKKIK